jgi:hypothetical protein
MTAKTWCTISRAVEMVVVAQGMSEGLAQAWLIEACAAGKIRSRVLQSAHADPVDRCDDMVRMHLRPPSRLSIFRKRAPGPVAPGVWGDAVIDGDTLVDADRDSRRGIEVSITDLDFELKRLPPAPEAARASAPIPKKKTRSSDKDNVAAEAERRLIADENIPPSLAAFSRDLYDWLDEQPWARRGLQSRKVLAPSSIEDRIRPLWRKYRTE